VADRPPGPWEPAPGRAVTERPSRTGPDRRTVLADEPKKRPRSSSRVRRIVRDAVEIVVVAFVVALVLRTFVVQAFFIPSGSMVPTLRVGDRVLVNKLVYTFGDIQRFDVVVFEDPTETEDDPGPVGRFVDWLTEGLGFARPAHEDFIKRVIAFEGETWEIRDGRLYVDGERVPEPYVKRPLDTRSFPIQVVPEGMLAVLGDNRLVSADSRFGLGYVPADKVVGEAFVVVWPPSRVAWLSGSST